MQCVEDVQKDKVDHGDREGRQHQPGITFQDHRSGAAAQFIIRRTHDLTGRKVSGDQQKQADPEISV